MEVLPVSHAGNKKSGTTLNVSYSFSKPSLLFFLCADNYRWPEIPLSITTYLKALNCRLIWKAALTVTYGFLAQLARRWYCSLLHNRAWWGIGLTFLKDKLTEHTMLLPLYPFTHVEWLFSPHLAPQISLCITHPWTAWYPQHECDRSPVFPLDEQW